MSHVACSCVWERNTDGDAGEFLPSSLPLARRTLVVMTHSPRLEQLLMKRQGKSKGSRLNTKMAMLKRPPARSEPERKMARLGQRPRRLMSSLKRFLLLHLDQHHLLSVRSVGTVEGRSRHSQTVHTRLPLRAWPYRCRAEHSGCVD